MTASSIVKRMLTQRYNYIQHLYPTPPEGCKKMYPTGVKVYLWDISDQKQPQIRSFNWSEIYPKIVSDQNQPRF